MVYSEFNKIPFRNRAKERLRQTYAVLYFLRKGADPIEAVRKASASFPQIHDKYQTVESKISTQINVPLSTFFRWYGDGTLFAELTSRLKLNEHDRKIFADLLNPDAPLHLIYLNANSQQDKSVYESVRSAISTIKEDEIDQYFTPQDNKDARERIAVAIARRRGQPKFRRNLLSAYEGKCAITGSGVKDVLEAAHIVPYKGEHTNKLANGLLLRADIHTLFDLGLIAIDTTTMTIIIAPTLANTEYEDLKGSELSVKPAILQRIKTALDEHRHTHFGN